MTSSTMLIAFAASTWFPVSLSLLVVVGAGMSAANTTITALSLTRSDEAYHGRIMSLTQVCWGLSPIGGMLLGTLASRFGAPWGIGVGGAVLTLFVATMFAWRPQLLRL